MTQRMPVVAVVGRTNVGKSTLFNQIAGRHRSIVDDALGVTRDRNYAVIKRFTQPFSLVDTGGLIGEEDRDLAKSIRIQAEIAIAEARLILAVFDGDSGPHPHDQEVVNLLRQTGKPVLWVVNKCEKPAVRERAAEFYGMGLDAVWPVSAAHNLGMRELLAELSGRLKLDELPAASETGVDDAPIRIALIGKPNVGK